MKVMNEELWKANRFWSYRLEARQETREPLRQSYYVS